MSWNSSSIASCDEDNVTELSCLKIRPHGLKALFRVSRTSETLVLRGARPRRKQRKLTHVPRQTFFAPVACWARSPSRNRVLTGAPQTSWSCATYRHFQIQDNTDCVEQIRWSHSLVSHFRLCSRVNIFLNPRSNVHKECLLFYFFDVSHGRMFLVLSEPFNGDYNPQYTRKARIVNSLFK